MKDKLAELVACVVKAFPDAKAVKVKLRNGSSISIDIPKRTFADEHGGLNESELLVSSCLPPKGEPGVTTEWLMNRTGYKSKHHLYRVLRQLRKKGFMAQDDKRNYRRA